jgi:uncharacterized protein YndB with AHSA1/START domain
MARYTAARELLAPPEDVWEFVAEPHHLGDWWPGVGGVTPDRRGLAPGARWVLHGPSRPGNSGVVALFTRPTYAAGTLLVTEVRRPELVKLHFVHDRMDVELRLEPRDGDHTQASLVVDAPVLRVPRKLPHKALSRLYALCQTAATL